MFQLAILLHFLSGLHRALRKALRATFNAQNTKTAMKWFEKVAKILVGIFAVLWIMIIIVVKHLLKVIWEFK